MNSGLNGNPLRRSLAGEHYVCAVFRPTGTANYLDRAYQVQHAERDEAVQDAYGL